jgi:osmotically-inducible protein OsmY
LDASDITVEVKNAEVTLMGSVPNRKAKRLATGIADSIGGVRDVHNRLEIQQITSDRT